ncbi:hypothetical protein GYH30_051798 [Glycine max]|uniref:Uncharacterized protein n=1 Tax=Glycine max TaxID=3847 RepID=A0A0R0EH51_SOYBN|nr:hypothetical protein GYH30_051798 [Glycine max]
MTLLEVIKDASLPEVKDESSSSLVEPLIGWPISQTDAEIIDINKKFLTQLKAKLKNSNNLDKGEFISSLNSYLENIEGKLGIVIGVDSSRSGYTRILIDKLGVFIGKDVASLVLDENVSLEIWEMVRALIVNSIIEHSCYSNLVTKYFLTPSKDAYNSMVTMKKKCECQALLAIEKASDRNLKRKNLLMAKEASIMLMMAYDGFSVSDICLHYLIASSNINDVMLSPSFRKLNDKELINLIHYLAKWLKKYERFPQAGPCPKEACDWVPKLEDVIKCLGLVLDENFSSLVLHPQFHEELRSMKDWLVV